MEMAYQTNSNYQRPVKQAKNRRKEKLLELFMRLKKAHGYYKLYGNDPKKHEEILAKSEPLITELESLGVHRSFSEALLFFGKEFVDFEFGLTTKQVEDKPDSEKDRDIVSEAEIIFGAKARRMTDEEIKIHQQVSKEALVYTVKDGKPKILVYRKGKGVSPQA